MTENLGERRSRPENLKPGVWSLKPWVAGEARAMRVSSALGTRLPPCLPRASRGLAKPSRDGLSRAKPAGRCNGNPERVSKPSRALAPPGEARLRLRVPSSTHRDGNPVRVSKPSRDGLSRAKPAFVHAMRAQVALGRRLASGRALANDTEIKTVQRRAFQFDTKIRRHTGSRTCVDL
jgi:hypothetical protein